MNLYGEFMRGLKKSEDHLGERYTRPVVILTFGEWEGDRYQGEWAFNLDGYLDLHGWGVLVSENGKQATEGYFMNGLMHGKCR